MSTSAGTIAYCIEPKAGGTYNFYRVLRGALEPRGWRVRAVAVGAAAKWDPAFADEGCVRVAEDETGVRAQARAFVDWCAREGVDIVMPMGYLAPLSALVHLPPEVRVVMRCNNITRHTYDIVTHTPERVSRICVSSLRQRDDLARFRGVAPERIALIPHAVDEEAFGAAYAVRIPAPERVRLGYVGRLENASKGVLLLPRILRRLDAAGVPWEMTIAGDGPDEGRLRRRLAEALAAGRVTMPGRVPHGDVARLEAAMDVFLMPSYYEGFGFALVEAMAAGAVPVVSRIRGVTDWIVRDGETGVLCRPGRAAEFADAVARLHADRGLLAAMSRAAHESVLARFGLGQFADGYDSLFRQVLLEPPMVEAARPWSEFAECPGFRATWRRFVPGWAKALVRRWLERLGRPL